MTVRVLALKSGVTAEDHRLGLGLFVAPNGGGVLERRGGVLYYPPAADLVAVSAMQAKITSFCAVVDGTSSGLQGCYPVVVDADETLTFEAGEPAVVRTDRVIVQIRDNPYDASGFQDGRIVYLKGQPSGAATGLPVSSLLLWEVSVPAGASAGTGGINFAAARVDKRSYTSFPFRVWVTSQGERDALPAVAGLEVRRLDTGDVEMYRAGAWKPGYGTVLDPLLALQDPWTGYTPAWTAATNPAIGNGTLAGAYKKIGRTVFVRFHLVAGSATSFGSGAWSFTLPAAPVDRQVLAAHLSVGGGTRYTGTARISGGLIDRVISSTATSSGVSATNPGSWASGDLLYVSGSYEAAT